MSKDNYSSQSIRVLKGLEAVQVRPGMYIGNTDDGSGLHHMVYEVTDNSVDESLAGFCKNINIIIHKDGSVSVEDDGRGIPTDIHEEEGVSAAEVIMTQLHAGGKFDQDTYKISGGLHGVGVSVVNALSDWLELVILRNDKIYFMRFRKGAPESSLREITLDTYISEGEADPTLEQRFKNKKSGTYIRFKPDANIFSTTEFSAKILSNRYRELAFLNPGLRFTVTEEATQKTEEFFDEGGVKNFVLLNSKNKDLLFDKPFDCQGEKDGIQVDLAMVWAKDFYDDNTSCFTNNIPQKEGGTHLQGFRAALTKVLQKLIPENKLKNGMICSGEDIREGLFTILSVKVPNPRFASQTKEKLVSTEVRGVVDQIVTENLTRWLEENPNLTKVIVDRILQSISARAAAKKARELVRTNKSVDYSFSVAGKLADCTQKNPEVRELFIVEGQSAGGSAKMARNRDNQAVLALQGKILNVEKAAITKILQYDAIRTLIAVLNTGIEQDCLPEACKYHKIIIMTDADVDGSHIRTLLLTFFFRYMRPLIEAGYVYVSRPPLYGIKSKKHNTIYLKDDQELQAHIFNNTCKILNITQNNQILDDDAKAKIYDLSFKTKKEIAQFKQLANAFIESGVAQSTFMEEDALKLERYLNQKYTNAKIDYIQTQDTMLWDISFEKYDKKEKHVLQLKQLSKDVKEFLNNWQSLELKVNSRFFPSETALALINSIDKIQSEMFEVARFKGLGEMNPKELKDTSMLPDQRIIEQISFTDLEHTDYITKLLMGEDVPLRRKFIEENALNANVDL